MSDHSRLRVTGSYWQSQGPFEGYQTIGGSKGGARDAPPPGVQILSFLCSFWQKNCKIIAVLELAPPPRGNPGSATADPAT